MSFWLLLAGFLALGALIFWLSWYFDKKRTEAMRAFAAERDWTFLDKDKHDRPRRYRDFEPFSRGDDRHARWVFTGARDGVGFELFSYHYEVTTHSNKGSSTTHYWHQVCTIEMPVAAPDLVIRDEHIGHRLWDAVGGEDIDFESDAFSRAFWVKCNDRKFAYDVIDARMMAWLLERSGWLWQWRGTTLMLVKDSKLDLDEVDEMLALAMGFRERVPRHVVVDARRR